MDSTTVYLGNVINEYKSLTIKERKGNYQTNYRVDWDYHKHQELLDIANVHGISLRLLIKIILENFLICRKKYNEVRMKLK
ncbi:hypothetical protein LCGC14_0560310 [marine sediment metagenome]|uniref:Uncharacterized protein n=1 Tax=marine sediment metagenome TaxID=412755 RepID=A0A0F9UVJ2_9ZZZZ